ncbi:MAG: nucleoside triphosphate pyrophosphohydrolase [Actinobacteria bacterium]|nr:nucleoside triphosphate pyrophosphohydrolase [Actinomycetota bacterium]MCG2789864.1 nucleoside triphosphate pyrophosphohydrolase [Actinomycetes bacterium]
MTIELTEKLLNNLGNTINPGELFLILVAVMEKLRSEKGCVWDREQTHKTIKKNLVEEAYEAVESIEGESYQELKEELGDILLQVVFHSQIAQENSEFDINDVLRNILNKLVRRHPHVFGDKLVAGSQEVLANWEDIKKEERKEKSSNDLSVFTNIPKMLPSLHYANEIQSRAARFGFDWEKSNDVLDKIKEEIEELERELSGRKIGQISDELGDILFSIVNLSRRLKIDSEESLKNTCKKFINRFDFMEDYALKHGLDFKNLSLVEKEELWEIAKKS